MSCVTFDSVQKVVNFSLKFKVFHNAESIHHFQSHKTEFKFSEMLDLVTQCDMMQCNHVINV